MCVCASFLNKNNNNYTHLFFQWFIDVRGCLKGRLSKKLFKAQAKKFYQQWLQEQPDDVPKDEKLKFSDQWIKFWCQEYNVSLKKPNKRYSISYESRKERIEDYLKNVIRVRKFFIDKYNKDPPIINGDQVKLFTSHKILFLVVL